jgi:hypothetical protein
MTLATVDAESAEACILGFASFPLFMDKVTKRPITQLVMNPDNVILHAGPY